MEAQEICSEQALFPRVISLGDDDFFDVLLMDKNSIYWQLFELISSIVFQLLVNKIGKIQKVACSKICMKDPEVVSDWISGNGVGKDDETLPDNPQVGCTFTVN